MRAQQHEQRLAERKAQTQQWSAPLPDFSVLPRPSEAARMRVEWDTRDTMNNRLWTHTQLTGAKAVTATMLANYPTAGAEPFAPSSARQDARNYVESQYFPNGAGLPPRNLSQNPWMQDMDVEGPNVARELRGAVKESRREAPERSMAARTFEHQWVPPTVTNQILNTQISAAEALRPRHDDYRFSYRNA